MTTIDQHYFSSWWICRDCGKSFPRDYQPNWCDKCPAGRLRKNDDIRLAHLHEAERKA